MEHVQNGWNGLKTVAGVFGDSFLVAVAISAAVSTAVILGTNFTLGL